MCKLFFAIRLDNHFSLMVVDMVNKVFTYFDPFHLTEHIGEKIFKNIVTLLDAEYNRKKKHTPPWPYFTWTFNKMDENLPKAECDIDSVVYVLLYTQLLILNQVCFWT